MEEIDKQLRRELNKIESFIYTKKRDKHGVCLDHIPTCRGGKK